jgi:signal transduction histidine kinase
VVLDLEPVPLTGPSVRYELLAATREAITNAAVHSGAERVSVRLQTSGDRMCVEVADEGKGFDMGILPEREREGHFGVRGYTERLRLIGGEATVESTVGAGTTVTLLAPALGLLEESRDH